MKVKKLRRPGSLKVKYLLVYFIYPMTNIMAGMG
jgi:hypothetical protein